MTKNVTFGPAHLSKAAATNDARRDKNVYNSLSYTNSELKFDLYLNIIHLINSPLFLRLFSQNDYNYVVSYHEKILV